MDNTPKDGSAVLRALKNHYPTGSYQIVDSFPGELWVGYEGPEAETAAELLRREAPTFTVTSHPPESLSVPFRDSIRREYSTFFRMKPLGK